MYGYVTSDLLGAKIIHTVAQKRSSEGGNGRNFYDLS